MVVLIDNRTEFVVSDEIEVLFIKVCDESLDYEKTHKSFEISISIVTDEEIRQINKEFRRIDRATDVLSFPQFDFSVDKPVELNENVLLGDIIISIDRAKNQAEEYGHSLERELAFLTAHSMLHLLGYDHETEEEEKDMLLRQKNILLNAGIPR